MIVVSNAVAMAVMTEARVADVKEEGHVSRGGTSVANLKKLGTVIHYYELPNNYGIQWNP